MEDNARVRGLYVVAKFIDNADKNSSNTVLTKTLGKFGFVNTDYQGPIPNHDEFWLVRIDREIHANSLKGCFVLTPIRGIPCEAVSTLRVGIDQYREMTENGIRYILPCDKEKYYVMPLAHRKSIKEARVVLVVNFVQEQFVPGPYFFTPDDKVPVTWPATPYDGVAASAY